MKALAVTHRKPTPEHWQLFIEKVLNMKLLDDYIDIAMSQSFWTYVRTTNVMEFNGSSIESQQNSTLIMVYLHVLRMVLGKFLEDTTNGPLSLNFLKELATINEEDKMIEFINQVRTQNY